MIIILAVILLCSLAAVTVLSPLWRRSADADRGDGQEIESRVSAWNEEKNRLVSEIVSLDLAYAEGRLDRGSYEKERSKIVSEAESAANELRKARSVETGANHTPRTYPIAVGLLASSLAIATVALVVLINGNDVRTKENPHASGRIPVDGAQANVQPDMANAATGGGNQQLVTKDGAPDVGAMVAKLEAKVKAGGASLDDTMMLARSYRVLGREDESVATYRKAQEMAPNERPIGLVLASALLRTGKDSDRDEAERIVDKALLDEPAKPEALWLKSLGLIRRHEIEPAKEILNKLKGMVGQNSDASNAVTGLLAELASAGPASTPAKASGAPVDAANPKPKEAPAGDDKAAATDAPKPAPEKAANP